MTTTSVSSDLSASLDPRAIIVFEQVCLSGSISGAARALGVSQPSVSQTVALLEARLGVALLKRQSRGVEPTREGEALRSKASALSQVLRDARATVERASNNIAGPIRIGGTPGALVSLVPQVIRHLDRQDIRFEMSVIEASDHALSDMLRRREIELAFVTTGIASTQDEFSEWTVAQDPFALIVGRAHQELPSRLSLGSVSTLPWVLPRVGGGFQKQIQSLFMNDQCCEPANVIRCDSLLTTKAIVRMTDRITILPRQVVESELSVGVLRAIDIEHVTFQRQIGIRALATADLSPLAQRIVGALSEP
ncbi:LysR family transcriptional regulator [Novosphingobium flavum]|uniref:LysR family transcriptional regulator n=1 Tax=Novosphingobium aerophilum TaxID=2839843 RepID=UPI00163B1ACE|nr:LysR family transcriptional regulator [Novosphingobium aerophilum]MBC2663513.1 LysR family transcriptional regulator [Novosphingobium aerophilum]